MNWTCWCRTCEECTRKEKQYREFRDLLGEMSYYDVPSSASYLLDNSPTYDESYKLPDGAPLDLLRQVVELHEKADELFEQFMKLIKELDK